MMHRKPKGLTNTQGLSRAQRQYLKSFQQKKYRYKRRQFLVEGTKLLNEALEAGYSIREIFISRDLDLDLDPKITTRISDADIAVISSLKTPEGIVAIADMPDPTETTIGFIEAPFIYLWKINDPGNMGAILRSARWFGIQNILLSPNSVDPYSPKVVRGSMGALFHIRIFQDIDIEDILSYGEDQAIFLMAADAGAPPVRPLSSQKWGLILGSESHGLPGTLTETSVQRIGIPQQGSGESLNLSVAAGILIHEIIRNTKG